ncbi:aconitase family protein, partial [Streptococcus suis]
PKRLLVEFVGQAQRVVYAKYFFLALIARYGVDCGLGLVVEFAGPVIVRLSMEERMTIFNMSIELGSKMGIMAPDLTT